MRSVTLRSLAVALALAWVPRLAVAQTAASSGALSNPTARAVALFNQGNDALARHDYPEARKLFRQSAELDPSPVAERKIGKCWLEEGDLSRAAAAFRRALVVNEDMLREPEKRDPRRARLRAEILQTPRIPRLNLSVTGATSEVELLLDGEPLRPAMLDGPIPVEPGEHELRAKARDRDEVSHHVSVAEGQALAVTLAFADPLTKAEAPAPPPPTTAGLPPPGRAPTVTKRPPLPVSAAREVPEAPIPATRMLGWTLAGVGAVGLGVAGYFEIHTLLMVSGADCNGRWVCSDGGAATIDDARREQTRAIVTGSASAVVAGIGAVLLLRASDGGSASKLAFGFGGDRVWLRQAW